MPLLAMMAARFLMLITVIGSMSVYFYFYILRDKTTWRNGAMRPNLAWDFANRRTIIIIKDPGLQSSITGQIFNHHPGVFYMDEPLYPFEMFKTLNYTKESEYNGQVRAFLDNLFNCRFYGYSDYLTFLSHPGLTSPRFRLSSKSLSSPPLCYNYIENYTSVNEYSSNCPLLNAKWVSRVCARKPHIVITIVAKRAPGGGLTGFLPLMTSEAATNVRVLNVVTDPRARVWDATLRDRVDNLEAHAQRVCAEIDRDINSSLSVRARVLSRYKILRYEDVMRNLSAAAPEVIRSTDIHYMSTVREWVREKADDWLREQRKYTSPFDDWRLAMTLDHVTVVERYCSYAMRMLGYGPIKSIEELRDTKQSLLIKPELHFEITI